MSNMKVVLDADCQGFKQGMNDGKKAVEEFGNTVNKQSKQANTLAGAMRTAKKDAMNLAYQLSQLSEEQKNSDFGQNLKAQYDQAVAAAGNYKDMMMDVNQEIKNMASDTQKLDQVIGVFQGMNAVIQVGAGIMGTFGAKTEDVERVTKKLVAIMSIAQGLQTIQNLLQEQSVLMQLKKTVATKAATVAQVFNTSVTKGDTIAQTAWNTAKAIGKALLGDFTGLLLVGAGALATYAIASSDAADEQKELNKAQSEGAETIQEVTTLKEAQNEAELEATKSVTEETAKIQILNNMLHDNTRSLDDRKNALNQLKAMVPDYHGSLTKEGNLINDNTSALTDYINKLWKAAQVQARFNQLVKAEGEYLDNSMKYEAAKSEVDMLDEMIKGKREALAAANKNINAQGHSSLSEDEFGITELVKQRQAAARKMNQYGLNAANAADKSYNLRKQMEKDYNAADFEKPGGNKGDGNKGGNSNKSTTKAVKEHIDGVNKYLKQLEDIKKKMNNTNLTGDMKNKLDAERDKVEKSLSDYLKSIKKGGGELEDEWKKYIIYTGKEMADEMSKVKIEPIKITDLIKIPEGMDQAMQKLVKAKSGDTKLYDLGFADTRTDLERAKDTFESYRQQYEDTLGELAQTPINTSTYDELIKKVEELKNKSLEAYEAYKSAFEADDALNKTIEKYNNIGTAINEVGNALSSLGSAFELPALNVMGTIAQAIANITLSYSQALAQAASMGPWAWVAFGAAGLAQMAAIIASIKQQAGGFANGGIIQGNTAIGDQMLIRANAGEMVLNRRQQSNLFNMLDEGRINNPGGRVEVVGKLKGSDIYLSQSNYKKINSRTNKNI